MRLPSLLGNPRLKAAVAGMAQAPGAPLLLDGPEGSGKRTAALELASALLCREPGGDSPCGLCPACVRMKGGSHPDFYQLPYEGKAIKVDQVRALRTRTFLKPQEADFKVILIHAADRLSSACQNALLKVLEEPQSCQFILLCENREALLQTIRSRCSTYSMEPLDALALEAALRARGATGDLSAAVEAAGGFLGQALAFLNDETPPWQAPARQLAEALGQGELAIYQACLSAGKLGRDEYSLFLDQLSVELTRRVSASGDARLVSIHEYIAEQQAILAHNPSLTGLVGALAAFCGQVMQGLPAQAGAYTV